jgi:cytochrome c-type biogenesis protein CcmH/NrfG
MTISMAEALPVISAGAARKEEGNVHYAMMLGDYQTSQGNHKAAEDAYALAVGHSPDNVRARIAMGDSRMAQNQRMKALMTYSDALRTRPHDAKTLATLAAVLDRDQAEARLATRKPAAASAPVAALAAPETPGTIETAHH